MDRRQFLKGVASLGAFGACQSSPAPGIASASSERWGATRPENRELLLPAGKEPAGMLEMFLVGGLSPWETFYTVPEFGDPKRGGKHAGTQFWTFNDDKALSTPHFVDGCGYAGRPLYQPFGLDSAGVQVNLGPFVHPLRERPDILSRMRVWVMRHDAEPHPAGIPYALTGHRLGSPRLAGHGAHVQRYFQELSGTTNPMSYALYLSTGSVGGDHSAAGAVGLHRASARPLALQFGPDLRLVEQLYRPGVRGHERNLDALVNHYVRRHADRLKTRTGGYARSAGMADFAFAQETVSQFDTVANLLDPSYFQLSASDTCRGAAGPGEGLTDETTPALRLAAHLLTNTISPARHVTVMDSGLHTDPVGQGYDSHASHVDQQGTNAIHAMTGLASIINQPGELDPKKLDLDRHFVFINTEFGRSPFREVTVRNPGGGGTNHWPWGYVVVGFGAFADEERSKVVGAIGEDAYAIEALSPEELRAGLLLAQGIWPFSPESFAVGDLRVASSERDAVAWLREHVLGYRA